jgi:O-acetyl-ADP-ribose deacetylase (regulator of RNase III)
MDRIRQAMQVHQSFYQVLQDGLLTEKDPRKQQMKRRLILFTAYELAKADGSISSEEQALHNRMAKIMGMQEPEIQEMRRLLLLKSGINIHDRITVVQGDITQESVDAVVNSTNPNLRPGQKFGLINLPGNRHCVDTLMHKIAGPELKTACQQLDDCEVGAAQLTKGYNLPAHWVIHTVTPIWQDNPEQARSLLHQCYRNSLAVACGNSVETIAFPALGTGTGQIPGEQAAAIAIATVRAFLDMHFTIKQVRFVCNDAQVYQQFVQALESEIGILPESEAFDASTLEQQSHHHYETKPQAA